MEKTVLKYSVIIAASLCGVTPIFAQSIFGFDNNSSSQMSTSAAVSAWQNAANAISQQRQNQIHQQIQSTQSKYPQVPPPSNEAAANPNGLAPTPPPAQRQPAAAPPTNQPIPSSPPPAPVVQTPPPLPRPTYNPPPQAPAPVQQQAPYNGFDTGTNNAPPPSSPDNSGGWNIKY